MREILLDTSPLITLCTFRAQGQLVVEHFLKLASFQVARTVALEATANPAHSDAAVVDNLLKEKRITDFPVPSTPLDAVIDAYTKLGQGERDTMRLALTLPAASIVLDDYLAFVIAARFGLKPIFLLDLIVSFVEDGVLEKPLALEVVEQVAARYSPPFVNHTRFKLK
jgi:predicted nucleic acid-binding protein